MDQRIQKIISIFLAISLLLTGLHADTVPAEDLFACDLIGKPAANLAPCHSDFNNDAICTTKLPSVQGTDLESRTSYQHQYREISEFLYLRCSGFGSLSQGKSHIHHTATYVFYQTRDELISEYMHQSDGKKRI